MHSVKNTIVFDHRRKQTIKRIAEEAYYQIEASENTVTLYLGAILVELKTIRLTSMNKAYQVIFRE